MNGKALSLAEYTRLMGLPESLVFNRLKSGHSLYDATFLTQKEIMSKKMSTHGLSGSMSYRAWSSMHSRCLRDKRYIKKGIKVCEEWQKFEGFFESMGHRPEGMSLDRINGAGNYEPSNCRWATAKQQARNFSRNVMVTAFGQTLCLAEWSEKCGIKAQAIGSRIKNGYEPEHALTLAVSYKNPKVFKKSQKK